MTATYPLSVLIVDDNADNASSWSMLLGLLGYQTFVAFSGRAALDLVEAHRPDVVVCDICMPGMDGYEVARRVRTRAGRYDPYMIALTARVTDQDRQRCLEAGFNLHLAKPADPEAFHRLLKDRASAANLCSLN